MSYACHTQGGPDAKGVTILRILQLCLAPSFGGLEINMCDLSRWLASRPDVELAVGFTSGTRVAEKLGGLPVPQIAFSKPCGKLPLRPAWRLARWIAQHEIDGVHVHWKKDLPLVAMAKRLCRRPFRFVHTRHMNLPGRKHDPYHAWLYGSLDRLIVVTHYLHRQALAHLPIDPERVTPIHYGVAFDRPADREQIHERCRKLGIPVAPREGFHIGLFGRIYDYKGQHLLVDAVEQLRSQGKDVRAWIIGEPFVPEYLQDLKADVRRRGLADAVRFLGFQPHPLELMSVMDAVALTTRNETFGLVLVEAMRAGTAVIGSRAGGVPEIIDDGETGLLFESWNAADLARAIEQLYDDPALRQRLATAGQQKAMRAFDRDRQFQRVLEVLKESAAASTRRAA